MKKQLLKMAIAVLLPFIVTNVNAQNITINSSVDSVYVSDDFSSGSSTLVGSGSGIGWSGNWLSNQGTGIHVNTSSSLSYPSGSFFSSAGGYAYTNAGEAGISNKRLLTNGINLGGSTTFYVSFLAQKSASGTIRIDGQRSSDGLSRFGLGIEADGKLTVQAAANTVTSSTSLFENDKTYLVVARWDYVNSQADLKMVLFEEGETIPTTDVGLNWSHTDGAAAGQTGVVLQQFNFAFSAGESKIDEFKLGSTWASVTKPEATIAQTITSSYKFQNFDWENHPDQFADISKPVSYIVQIASDRSFSSIVDQDTVLLSRYVHDEPLAVGSYYQRQRSVSYDGLLGDWSDATLVTIEAPQTTVTVAAPSGTQDCTSSVQSSVSTAAAQASAGNTVKLVFPAGDYYFDDTLVGAIIDLENVSNIEIEGTGAVFHFSERNQGLIEARGCENISISGIEVTYAAGIFRVQGTVQSVVSATRTVTLELEEGSPDFEASSSPLTDIFILLDPTTDGRLKDNASTFYRLETKTQNADSTWTVTMNSGGDFSDWEVGDRFVYHFRSGSKHFVDFGESESITAHNLTTDGWGAMGFVSITGNKFNILNCKTVMQEGKWMMGNADGVHVRGHAVGPWIEGTEIQAIGDDGIALYARPASMSATKPNGEQNAVICVTDHFNLEVGDEVSFFQPNDGRIILETTVDSIVDQSGSYLVYFNDNIPDGIVMGGALVDVTQIWNRSKSCGDFMVTNSKFTNVRRYGTVFRAKGGVVENSQYKGISTQAILFHNEPDYPNGLYASEIILRNNTIDDSGFDGYGTQSVISFDFAGRGTVVQSIGPKNILIEDNVIENCSSPEIRLNGVDNINIRNNVNMVGGNSVAVQYSANRSSDITLDGVFSSGTEIYNISASSGNNGIVTPSGDVSIFSNKSETFTFTADYSYEVDDVLVNGISVGKVNSYTLSDVTANQTISVSFKKIANFVTVTPQADAYVHGGSYANNNYGSDTTLKVKTDVDSDTNTRKSYLRFDLPDTLMSVLSAKLRIKLSSINGASTSHAVSFVNDDSWDESTITWNNKPAEGTLLDSESTLIAGNWIELDVTAQVQNEQNGDGKISLIVTETGTVKRLASYFSKEADSLNRPVLAIVTAEGIIAEADAYVRNGASTTNYGSDATMVVKTDASSNSFDRQSYLRFNLSNYADTVTSAILRVKLKSLNGSSTTNNVKFVSDDSWGESTITWANKPTAGITLNTQNVDTEGWIEYDVTNQVETERLGDGKVSFVISDTTTTKLLATYHTKEAVSADDRPYLLINEPSSSARMASTITELNQSYIKLYPNPANGEFYITTPQSVSGRMQLHLFDLSGRTVLSKTINAEQGTNSIDISTIEKGLYIVRLNSNTFNYVGKLKVQ